MYPASASIIAGLSRSHSRSTKIEVFRDGQRVVTADQLPITDGSLIIDGTASTRRRTSVEFAMEDASLMPANGSDPLAPFGNEFRVTQTVTIDTGESAEIPLGLLRIAEPTGDDAGPRKLSVTAYDRSRAIQRARLVTPFTIPPGVNYAQSLMALINSRMANLIWNASSTNYVTPMLTFPSQDDPWADASNMADSFGAEIFFDPNGNPVLQPIPDPTIQPPVWTFEEGDNCTVLEILPDLSDDPGYNGFVVIGQPSTGAPVMSVAWDNNQSSATYYLGPYGEVPTFLVSQYIATQAQADSAAAAGLIRVLGVPETVTFYAIPNPLLDAGDVIRLRRPSAGVDDIYVIQTIELPYKIDGYMTVTAKRRKTA